MKESILHYVWQFRLFRMNNLKTTDGKMVEIIHPGLPNTDAGPDFFNAKIKIDDTLWAGNIEIHNQSSDWAKHRHTADKAYDNVILHVVNKADKAVFRTNGDPLPQLELEVPEHIRMNYNELLSGKKLATPPRSFKPKFHDAIFDKKKKKKTFTVSRRTKP